MYWLNRGRTTLAPKTTRRRYTTLRKYAQFAGLGVILDDWIAPKVGKEIAHPLPEGIEGVERMLEQATNDRQRALLALCGYCACRVSEALAATCTWFDLENMTLKILGKGGKERVVPLTDRAWEILADPVGHAFIAGPDTPIVAMQDRFARRIITVLGERAGLKRRVSSHDLRATLATHVFNKTNNSRIVQEMLGHESLRTTQIYLGIEFAELRAGMEL